MEPHDPYGWIVEGCQISSSEESRLNRCSYFGQSDSSNSGSDSSRLNPPVSPVARTSILMVSPPNSTHEIFRTPPESRSTSASFHNCFDDPIVGGGLDSDGGTVVVDADSADSRRAVDLGRDTDLGFSEVQVDSAQRVQANMNPDGTFRRESEEIRVSKRGVSPKEQLPSESLSNRFNVLGLESPSKSLGAPKGRNTNELLESLNKGFKNVSLSPGATEELELENQHNGEGGDESVRKRRLAFLSEIVASYTEERSIERENNNGGASNRGKGLEFLTEVIQCNTEERIIEIDQVRCSGEKRSNSCGMKEKSERKRALPSWADNGRVEKQSDRKRALPSSVNNGGMGGDENVDKELEDDETELLSSWSNGRVVENDGRIAELEDSEMETTHLDMNSDNLSKDVKKTNLLDVLRKWVEDYEDDWSLECLSVLEVAQRKWGAFS